MESIYYNKIVLLYKYNSTNIREKNSMEISLKKLQMNDQQIYKISHIENIQELL